MQTVLDINALITLSFAIDGTAISNEYASATYTQSCGDSKSIPMGNACPAEFDVEFVGEMVDAVGKSLVVKYNGTNLFTGKINEAKVSYGRTSVVAYDELYFSGATEYTPTGKDNISTIATAMGMEYAGSNPKTVSMPTGLSCAEALGEWALICGGNVIVNRDGKLQLVKFTSQESTAEVYQGGASAGNADYTASGLTLTKEVTTTTELDDGTTKEETETKTYIAGDGSISYESKLATQTLTNYAYSQISGLTMRSGSFSIPGGEYYEVGDVISILTGAGTYSVGISTISVSFDGGCKTSITGAGETQESSTGYVGTTRQAINQLSTEVASIKTLIADNATINSANIKTLQTEKITADRIDVDDLFAQDVTVKGEFNFDNDQYKITGSTDGVSIQSSATSIYTTPEVSIKTSNTTVKGKDVTLTADATNGNITMNKAPIIGKHDSAIGTVSQTSVSGVSLTAGASENVLTLALSEGVWVVNYGIQYSSYSGGRTCVSTLTSSSSNHNTVGEYTSMQSCYQTSGALRHNVHKIFNMSEAGNAYCYAYSSVACTATYAVITAVRIV